MNANLLNKDEVLRISDTKNQIKYFLEVPAVIIFVPV